jgi:5,10-methylenetetrahydromethanopterin reductase
MTGASIDRVRRGLSLYPTSPPQRLREIAAAAEQLEYDHLWFGDSQNLWREAYVTMGAAAVGTDRIVFGTGVTNGVTRHRSVLASAWATLHELTDGRVAAGFGVGDSALKTMGQQPMRVADLADLIADLRSLWRGEEIKDPAVDAAYRLGYLGHQIDVPVYIAASGPKLLDLTGGVADGVILLVGVDPVAVRAAIQQISASASAAGRRPEDIHVVLWAPVAIDADAGAARDRVRAHVARTLLRPVAVDLTADEQAAVQAIRDHYDYAAHMVPGSAHARLVPDQLVGRFAIAGTAEDCREQLDALTGAGVGEIAAIPFPRPDEPVERLLERFAAL